MIRDGSLYFVNAAVPPEFPGPLRGDGPPDLLPWVEDGLVPCLLPTSLLPTPPFEDPWNGDGNRGNALATEISPPYRMECRTVADYARSQRGNRVEAQRENHKSLGNRQIQRKRASGGLTVAHTQEADHIAIYDDLLCLRAPGGTARIPRVCHSAARGSHAGARRRRALTRIRCGGRAAESDEDGVPLRTWEASGECGHGCAGRRRLCLHARHTGTNRGILYNPVISGITPRRESDFQTRRHLARRWTVLHGRGSPSTV